MPNEVDDFLKDVSGEEDTKDPFKADSTDPFESKEPKDEKVPDAKEEEKLPFHKDPKIQRFIQKEIEKVTKDLKPTSTVEEKKEAIDEADEILTRIIGNDTPEKVTAIRDFKKYLTGLEEKGAEKALRKLQEEREQAEREDVEAENTLTQGLESIEENFSVDITSSNQSAIKIRSEFLEFVKKIAPKDSNGDVREFPDLEQAFETFQALRTQPKNTRAKDLAARGMSRSSDASAAPKNEDNSWKAVERMMSKL